MVQTTRGWVVVPAYNEEEGLPQFLADLARELGSISAGGQYAFTVLVVDDGSSDATSAVAARVAASPQPNGVSIRVLSLVRNFGHQGALLAGLTEASREGDFVVTMDADGEHPVQVVPALVRCWAEGGSIVHTIRRPHRDLSVWKRWSSSGYYRLLRRVSSIPIEPGMADFKLWDGHLLRQVAHVLPTCGSTRAFAAWLAPRDFVVAYDQRVTRRTSRFTSRKMWSLALNGIVRYSDLPLRLSLLLGVSALGLASLLAVFAIWAVATGRTVPGWASTMIAISVFSGLQSFSVGILSEYLLRNWFRHALPAFVVRRSRVACARAEDVQPQRADAAARGR